MTVISTSRSAASASSARPRPVLRRLGHRVDRVAHQVEDDLLQLDRVGIDRRQRFFAVESQPNVVQARVGFRERAQILDRRLQLTGSRLTSRFLTKLRTGESPRRAQRLGIDLLERGEHVLRCRGPAGGSALAGLRIGRDRGKRLVDLVRQPAAISPSSRDG